jgi:hypothetical protein
MGKSTDQSFYDRIEPETYRDKVENGPAACPRCFFTTVSRRFTADRANTTRPI